MQKPRNRKSQRAKITSSIYLQYVLHWIYFITCFLQKSFAKMTLLQNIYFYLRSHWEKFCFSFMVHFAAKDSKDINLYRFHMLISSHSSQHLDIPSVSTIRFTEIRKSYHTSFGAFLMHFWCTFPFFLHFTNSAKIHKKKLCKIFWISKIAKLVKLLALET